MGTLSSLQQAIASNAGVGGGLGQATYVAHAYMLNDWTMSGGSVQDLRYSNKFDPNSMIDITGNALKITIPASALGIVKVKTKLSPQSSFTATNNFFSLPIVYLTSGLVYAGAGDRVRATWTSGENNNGYHFPYGEAFFALTPGSQYTIKGFSDNSIILTGGTNGNGDVNHTYFEVW